MTMVLSIRLNVRKAFRGDNYDHRNEAEQAIFVIAFEMTYHLAVICVGNHINTVAPLLELLA